MQGTASEADVPLSARLRHAESPMSAKPVVLLCAHSSRSTAVHRILKADMSGAVASSVRSASLCWTCVKYFTALSLGPRRADGRRSDGKHPTPTGKHGAVSAQTCQRRPYRIARTAAERPAVLPAWAVRECRQANDAGNIVIVDRNRGPMYSYS